jgi:hypothetical protein
MSCATSESLTLNRESRLHEYALCLASLGLIFGAFLFLAIYPYMMFTGRIPVSSILCLLALFAIRQVPRSLRWIDATLMRTITRVDIDHTRQLICLGSWSGTRVVARFADIRSITYTPATESSPSESFNITLSGGRTFSLNPAYFSGGASTLLATLERAAASSVNASASTT